MIFSWGALEEQKNDLFRVQARTIVDEERNVFL